MRKLKRTLPAPGQHFAHKSKGKVYTMTVVKTERGIGYKVGSAVFRTPTGAAKAICGQDVNGWLYWHIDQ